MAYQKKIRRDLKGLILEYLIKSVSGNGGGICFEDWFHPYRNILSLEEIDAIEMARDFFDEPYKSKFQQILVALGPSTCRKHLKAKKEENHESN